MYSRRDFGRAALAAAGVSRAWGKLDSRFHGVQIGVQSYSFRDRPLDDALAAMKQIGFSECELYQGHVEPKMKRDELRQWRLSTPMSAFADVGRKFHQAGIQLYAYNYSFRDDFTDEEIDRGFQMARAMGARVITASSTVSAARRVGPFAEKHRMVVGMHGHSNTKDPNEFSTPQSFEQAMAFSRYIGVNLDIGHFFAAGFDPVDYIRKHHDKIVCLHLKDRKKDQGLNQPFGEGDTPIKPVLQLLKQNKWKIPANIEYEYKGADTVAEVKRCFEYCKQALA
jgi:sugar phosphate isomerase/epimerase